MLIIYVKQLLGQYDEIIFSYENSDSVFLRNNDNRYRHLRIYRNNIKCILFVHTEMFIDMISMDNRIEVWEHMWLILTICDQGILRRKEKSLYFCSLEVFAILDEILKLKMDSNCLEPMLVFSTHELWCRINVANAMLIMCLFNSSRTYEFLQRSTFFNDCHIG